MASRLLNLKKEDFVLKSDGRPQPISVFEESQAARPSAPQHQAAGESESADLLQRS